MMTYSVESVYATTMEHSQMEHSEMKCCEKPKADHSCCDEDQENSENHCSDSSCDCVIISNAPIFTFQKQGKLILISSFEEAEFSTITSAFQTPIFPIWTPPDIA